MELNRFVEIDRFPRYIVGQYPEPHAPEPEIIPEVVSADNLEMSFQKKFEEFNDLIEPEGKEVELKGWEGLQSKVERYLKDTLKDFFGEDLVQKLDPKISPERKIEPNEFERRIAQLIEERSTVFDEVVKTSDDKIKVPLGAVEERMLEKYGLDIGELRKQVGLFEDTVKLLAKDIRLKQDVLNKHNKELDDIKGWIDKIPLFMKDDETLRDGSLENILLTDLKKHVERIEYKKLLDDFKKTKIDLLYLLSSCDNFFHERGKCAICLTGDLTHCCSPCGHCFCLDCINKLRMDRCHICRQQVKHKVKLHIV